MNRKFLNRKNISGYLKSHWSIDIAIMIFTTAFIIAGMLVSLNRYWQYEVFYYNFGVFDQAIWKISRFEAPVIEHLLVGGKISLADHFDLSIFLLSPVFWITDRSEALLIIQAIFAGIAGFIIYKIGAEILKDKFLALAISSCYFLFLGIQNAVITDFHELTVMTLPLALTFLFIIRKKIIPFWILFLIVLGFKEVTFLLGIGIGIFIFFFNKKWRVHSIAAVIISCLWGYLAIKILIPYFSGGYYIHMPDLAEGITGKIYALVDNPVKRNTLYYSLLEFGFLPVFAPQMWFAIIQDYILRFLPKYTTTYWTLGLHYNAQISVLLSIASIFGFLYIQKIKLINKFKYLIALILIVSALIQFRFIHHGPFLMAINPALYAHTSNFKFLNDVIAKIPKNASIMAHNNLGVRFTHQKYIFLRENYQSYNPNYIVIDNRQGQNPNNYLFSPPPDEILKKVKNDKNYKLIYKKGDQYIFRKK